MRARYPSRIRPADAGTLAIGGNSADRASASTPSYNGFGAFPADRRTGSRESALSGRPERASGGRRRRSEESMKSILDPSFRYVPSTSTDLRKTFSRVRREIQRARAQTARSEAAPSQVIAFNRPKEAASPRWGMAAACIPARSSLPRVFGWPGSVGSG